MTEKALLLEAAGQPVLEARLGIPPAPRAGLVLCHPHPLYGGDMDSPVVLQCAEAARDAAVATLRFNFRGVGRSGGTHDEGRGETEDVQRALQALGGRLGSAPVALLGYSFGAWVAAAVAARTPAVAALALVAPPLRGRAFPAGAAGSMPTVVVCGTRDPYCAPPELDALRTVEPGAVVEQIDGADHFFAGALEPLGAAVRRWLERWLPLRPAGVAAATAPPSRPTG